MDGAVGEVAGKLPRSLRAAMTEAEDRAARMTLRSSKNQPHDDGLPTARTTLTLGGAVRAAPGKAWRDGEGITGRALRRTALTQTLLEIFPDPKDLLALQPEDLGDVILEITRRPPK